MEGGAIACRRHKREDKTLTLPMQIPLCVAVGASFALASRVALPRENLVRSAALWVLMAFQVTFFLPVGAFLLWRYPDWSFMYLFESPLIGSRDWTLAGLYPTAALAGFTGSVQLIRRKRTIGAVGVLAGGLATAFAVFAFGFRKLSTVGTTFDFRSDASSLPHLAHTPLGWILSAIVIVLILGWAAALWRLVLFNRARKRYVIEVVEIEVEVDDDQDAHAPKPSKSAAAKRSS